MSDLERVIRFAAVAEELSFSRAAKRLRVDQPWLSRQIQQLEVQLGFPLLVRSTRSVALTREGEVFYKLARRFSAVAEDVRLAMKDLSHEHDVTLRFGVNPYTFWVPARHSILREFETLCPRAAVKVVSNYSPRLISKLRKRSVDAALIPNPAELDDVEAIIVHRSRPALLLPREWDIASAPSVFMSDLAGLPVATTDPKLNPAVHASTDGPFFEAGAEPVIVPEGQPAIGYYAREQRLAVISKGYPEENDLLDDGFVLKKICGPVHSIDYAIAFRKEEHNSVVRQFRKAALVLHESMPDHLPAVAA
jgi:DNA-binding transcriptional LysR family regulator